MKELVYRCLFVLLFCVCSMGARADWTTVWSEDFNDASTASSLTGWTFVGSSSIQSPQDEYNSTKRLRLGSTTASSATTPAIGVSGNLILTFDYKRTSTYYTVFSITVIDGGTISESPTNYTLSDGSNNTAIFHIVNATNSTKIVFSTDNSGVYIDNIVVQAEVAAPVAVAAPTFSLAAGRYSESQTLTISCETEGASIYYTTDGTEPTNASTLYEGAITISTTQTVKAIAYKGETASEVTSAEYTVSDALFSDDFSGETNGYRSPTNVSYQTGRLDIGRSAILTFRMRGRKATNTATLSLIEHYRENNQDQYRSIYGVLNLTPPRDEWQTYKYAVPMQFDNSRLVVTITNTDCDLDDVVLVTPPTITLDESTSEEKTAELLQANINQIVDVATRRTLRGGIWNTLCLPFDVSRPDLYTALGPQTLVMTTYNSYADNVLTFSTVSGGNVITAGTPFLLKCDRDGINPTFRAVTITQTAPQGRTDNGVTFQGCFGSTPLATDGTDLFIGVDNNLYSPASGTNVLGGMRAFIRLATAGSRLSLAIDDGTTMIHEATTTTDRRPDDTVYTLQGQRVDKPVRGLYISGGKKIIAKEKGR